MEHDPDIMRAADHILDLGPGAGENGGKRHCRRAPIDEMQDDCRLAHRALSVGRIANPDAAGAAQAGQAARCGFVGARAHNLKNIDVEIPLGMLVAITGVSGSGKSTLVHDVLYQALALREEADRLGSDAEHGASARSSKATDCIDEIVLVDQSPIGRTPRSNPVTYIKAFDGIRDLFASLPEAQKRGFTAGHFSFNIPGGRCEICQGDGTVTVEMQFLADVELICEECKGTRYKPQVLEVRYQRQEHPRGA